MREHYNDYDDDELAEADVSPPPAKNLRRAARIVSLALYFMMAGTAAGAMAWGWKVSGHLKAANEKVASLENSLREAKHSGMYEGTSLMHQPQVIDPIEKSEFVQIVKKPANAEDDLLTIPLRSKMVKEGALVSADAAKVEFLERQVAESEHIIAVLSARNSELERMNLAALGNNPVAPTHETTKALQDTQKLNESWAELLQAPQDGEKRARLAASLKTMSDDAVLLWLDGVKSPESPAREIVLAMIAVRCPKGGDALARQIWSDILKGEVVEAEANAVLEAVEGYRTTSALATKLAIAGSNKVSAGLRARALFALAMAGDSKAAELMGDVFSGLSAGDKERLSLIELARTRKDARYMDGVLAAFADPTSTDEEIQLATGVAREFLSDLGPRLAELAVSLKERKHSPARLDAINALVAEHKAMTKDVGASTAR